MVFILLQSFYILCVVFHRYGNVVTVDLLKTILSHLTFFVTVLTMKLNKIQMGRQKQKLIKMLKQEKVRVVTLVSALNDISVSDVDEVSSTE